MSGSGSPAKSSGTAGSDSIGLVAAAAMGVGGMMGAGLYTLIGLAATSSGTLLPLAFLLGGFAAVFSVYSYARLGATYPSRGGAAEFLLEEFGEGVVSGGLNVFQYLSYLIATSLYAAGFAEYVGALAGDAFPPWAGKAAGAGVVVLFTLVNMVGSRIVGRAEIVIVGVEAAILIGFVVLGLFKADPERLASGGTNGAIGVITGAALLYVTYQGFGVVTNAAGEMRKPSRDLPRAMFIALGVVAVLYLVISTLVVTLLPLSQIVTDSGHVLADAGQAVAGRVGFVVIASAAILATASAVNATLFASTNVGYDVAENNQLSRALTRTVWRSSPAALFVSAVIVIALVFFFPLGAVGQMTSLAFLAVYGAVSFGHLRLREHTGAHAWPLVVAVVLNAALFAALLVDAIRHGSPSTWITLLVALFGSFAFEAVFRARQRRGSAQG
ncbi:MAG: APC family permease [Candidatus Nanopelagicales bacterium]|nr:APC family permease [Candidatus Nanopelagicales bacterium]